MTFDVLQVLGWVMFALVIVSIIASGLVMSRPAQFRWAYWVAMVTGVAGAGLLLYIILVLHAYYVTGFTVAYTVVLIVLLLDLVIVSVAYHNAGKHASNTPDVNGGQPEQAAGENNTGEQAQSAGGDDNDDSAKSSDETPDTVDVITGDTLINDSSDDVNHGNNPAM